MCLDCGSKLETCRAGDPKPFHTMATNPTTLDVWVAESTQLHLIQQQPRRRPSEECIISLLCHRPGFGLDLRLVVFMMLPPTSQSICSSDRTKRWAKDERQKTHFLHYSTILAMHVLCCKRQYLYIKIYYVHCLGKLYADLRGTCILPLESSNRHRNRIQH